MDIKKKIPKNVFTNKCLKNIHSFIDKHYTANNLIILALMVYITIISVYTPRSIIAFVNNSIVKIFILCSIVILGKNDVILGIFIATALLITINLDNSITLFEKKELFKNNSNKIIEEEKDVEEEQLKNDKIIVEEESNKPTLKIKKKDVISMKLTDNKKEIIKPLKLMNVNKKPMKLNNTEPKLKNNTCLQPHNKEYVEQNYHLCCQNNHWKKEDRLNTCKAVQEKICSENMWPKQTLQNIGVSVQKLQSYYGEDDKSVDSGNSSNDDDDDYENNLLDNL